MTADERNAIIETLSVMTFKDKAYFEKMSDREIIQAYEVFMKIN